MGSAAGGLALDRLGLSRLVRRRGAERVAEVPLALAADRGDVAMTLGGRRTPLQGLAGERGQVRPDVRDRVRDRDRDEQVAARLLVGGGERRGLPGRDLAAEALSRRGRLEEEGQLAAARVPDVEVRVAVQALRREVRRGAELRLDRAGCDERALRADRRVARLVPAVDVRRATGREARGVDLDATDRGGDLVQD